MLFCGSSMEGQGGVSASDENFPDLRQVPDRDAIRVSCSTRNTYIVTAKGEGKLVVARMRRPSFACTSLVVLST